MAKTSVLVEVVRLMIILDMFLCLLSQLGSDLYLARLEAAQFNALEAGIASSNPLALKMRYTWAAVRNTY